MSAPYSLDLRRRVAAAVDAGGATQAQVAVRFAVSLGWVKKLVRQRRRLGHLDPLGHRGGARRRLDASALDVVRAAVAARPDLSLEELRRCVRRRLGVRVSVPTLGRVLQGLGLARKKRRSSPPKPATPSGAPSAR